VRKQHGVLRTNCIDCLDRTNVAQFAAGVSALGRQLMGLGLAAQPDLDPRSSAASHLMSMYESMGNTLARQVCRKFFQNLNGTEEETIGILDLCHHILPQTGLICGCNWLSESERSWAIHIEKSSSSLHRLRTDHLIRDKSEIPDPNYNIHSYGYWLSLRSERISEASGLHCSMAALARMLRCSSTNAVTGRRPRACAIS